MLLRQFAQAVQLAVMKKALRAGEYRIIVDYNRRTRRLRTHLIGVDCCRAGNDAVTRGAALQLNIVAARALGGDSQLTVFLKAARVHQIVKVLACRAIPRSVAPLAGLLAVVVPGALQTLAQGLQLGAQRLLHGLPVMVETRRWCFVDAAYLPCQTGARLPINASTPSAASALPMQIFCKRASSEIVAGSSCSRAKFRDSLA